jgi:hypothetical protein
MQDLLSINYQDNLSFISNYLYNGTIIPLYQRACLTILVKGVSGRALKIFLITDTIIQLTQKQEVTRQMQKQFFENSFHWINQST